jgi:hypothetical protein
MNDRDFISGLSSRYHAWIENYRQANPIHSELQKVVDSIVFSYEKKERDEERSREVLQKTRNQPDKEGFVKVISRGSTTSKKRPFFATESRAQIALPEAKEQKTDKKSSNHFYRTNFQQERLERLEELKKKYEQTKQRISKIREHRRMQNSEESISL